MNKAISPSDYLAVAKSKSLSENIGFLFQNNQFKICVLVGQLRGQNKLPGTLNENIGIERQ